MYFLKRSNIFYLVEKKRKESKKYAIRKGLKLLSVSFKTKKDQNQKYEGPLEIRDKLQLTPCVSNPQERILPIIQKIE